MKPGPGARTAAGQLDVRPCRLEDLPVSPDQPFLQQAFWGRHKAGFGWQPRAFLISGPGRAGAGLLVLVRNLGTGLTLAYVPHGPARDLVEDLAAAGHQTVGKTLLCLARAVAGQLDSRPFCVRFDLDWVLSRRPSLDQDDAAVAPGPEQPGIPAGDPVKLRCGFRLAPLRKAGADIQPPDTVIIDLAAGREAVLAGMKAKTRYNVRLAEKKSVRIATAGPDGLDDWYRLYQETATRDRIAVHSLEYYRTLLEQNPDRCELLLASHEDDLLAGIIMLYCGQRATYLYGASANIKRNLMPAYLLQWTAMQRAIDRGCTSYDCFGIPPSSDPAHPMHGLFQFKTGFGGETVHHAGSWDAPVRPWLYALYGKAETLRQFWFKKVKKH